MKLMEEEKPECAIKAVRLSFVINYINITYNESYIEYLSV